MGEDAVMPVERDDLATRIIGHNVKALQWYDDDRVLRQEVYLTDANILNIGDYPPTGGGAAAGAGSSDPSYLTLGAHDDLDNERVFSSGNGLSASDGGAGGTYAVTVSLGTGLTFSGNDVVLDWSDTPTTIEPDDAAAAGTSVYAAKGDHTHAIVAAIAGTIQPDDSAAEGSATSFARSDHAHAIVAAAPAADSVNVAASAEGNATSFARSNHTHNLDEGITPTWTGAHAFQATITARDLIPEATDAYDLGSTTKLWRKGYLSELDALVFVETSISLVGGWLVIPKGQGTLPADLADTDDTCDFGQAMTVGDFVEIRAFSQVEYFEVGAQVAGTVYKIGLDGSGARNLDGSGANDWVAGTAYLILGQTGDGRISLYGADPSIKVIIQGAAYNANTIPVTIDSDGISITMDTSYTDVTSFKFDDGTTVYGGVQAYYDGASAVHLKYGIQTSALASKDVDVYLTATHGSAAFRSSVYIDSNAGDFAMTKAKTTGAITYKMTSMEHIIAELGDNAGADYFQVQAANDTAALTVYSDGDARLLGGLYVGGTGTDPDADDIHYDGNLKSVKSATAYDVYGFHPLTTPLTHTSFNGDSFSDAAATKIENTSWSSTIPADAKALLIRIAARDSGSSGETTIHFEVGPSNAQPDALSCRLAGLADDAIGEEQGVVPCTDGDIWYGVEASGASTLDCWLECWGYWI